MHIWCDWNIGPGCRSSLPCSCDLCLGAWGLPRAPSTEQLLVCCRDRPPSWNNTACSQTGLGSSSAGQLWANVQEAWIIEGFSIQKKTPKPTFTTNFPLWCLLDVSIISCAALKEIRTFKPKPEPASSRREGTSNKCWTSWISRVPSNSNDLMIQIW